MEFSYEEILEMDNNEKLPMLESNDSFAAKVEEAVQVQVVVL